jgi:hypothetical protein
MLLLLGTAVPDEFILVHEENDHYLLQPAVEMTVDGKVSF